jgi:acyl-CoA thioesterase-2
VTTKLDELVALLALERLEQNLFRGRSQDLGWGTVFGGQVLGQALSAAAQTVPEERQVHSLHAYFLRTGAVDRGIIYDVDRIRDGRSFTTRRVVAIQNGRAIFNLAASFQVDEPGLEHQDQMPEVPPPEQLPSTAERMRRVVHRIPEKIRPWATAERPIETRPADERDVLDHAPSPPHRAVWYRAAGALPDDPSLHRYLLAYASDFHLLATAMFPHGVSWLMPTMQVASLDHAMWFHRPFRLDEWLLYAMDSPSSSGARGLVRGRFFDRGGRLVASVMQEGLMRQWSARANGTG